jgi:hypothetical protein
MWLQGDIYRRKNPGKGVKGAKIRYPIYSLKHRLLLESKASDKIKNSKSESSFSKIVNKVENIKIEDDDNGNGSPERSSHESDEENGNSEGCTQGDKLKQIKALNQNTPQKSRVSFGQQSVTSSPRGHFSPAESKTLVSETLKPSSSHGLTARTRKNSEESAAGKLNDLSISKVI